MCALLVSRAPPRSRCDTGPCHRLLAAIVTGAQRRPRRKPCAERLPRSAEFQVSTPRPAGGPAGRPLRSEHGNRRQSSCVAGGPGVSGTGRHGGDSQRSGGPAGLLRRHRNGRGGRFPARLDHERRQPSYALRPTSLSRVGRVSSQRSSLHRQHVAGIPGEPVRYRGRFRGRSGARLRGQRLSLRNGVPPPSPCERHGARRHGRERRAQRQGHRVEQRPAAHRVDQRLRRPSDFLQCVLRLPERFAVDAVCRRRHRLGRHQSELRQPVRAETGRRVPADRLRSGLAGGRQARRRRHPQSCRHDGRQEHLRVPTAGRRRLRADRENVDRRHAALGQVRRLRG